MINGLHGKVEGHELTDGAHAVEGGADGHAGEARLGDGRVNDPLVAVLAPQALGDLVGAVVLGHLLADDEHLLVSLHLLVHGRIEGVTNGQLGEKGKKCVIYQFQTNIFDNSKTAQTWACEVLLRAKFRRVADSCELVAVLAGELLPTTDWTAFRASDRTNMVVIELIDGSGGCDLRGDRI